MIYLNNNTILQDVYIPRQDMLQYTTGSSGTYAEGYADGYDDGTQDQKEKLTVTAFTENGSYQRENGWSGVTVNVPQTGSTARLEEKTVVISADTTNVAPSSGYDGMSAVTVDASEYAQQNYDDGFDDGFTDGYSSGHTEGMDDQKALLVSTAFTENGNYTRENGWSGISVNVDTATTYQNGYNSGITDGENSIISTFTATTATTNGQYGSSAHPLSAITVNVPSGETYNVEQNRYVSTAHSGTLVIHPSSGYSTSVSGTFDTGNSRFNMAIMAYNYPSIGTFELVKVVDESDQSKGEIVFNLTNGSIVVDDTNWSGSPFNPFIQEGTYMTGWFYDANEHYKVVEGADYYYAPFDVMSAVTVDITVPEYNVEVDKSFTATSNGNYVIKASNASTTIEDEFYTSQGSSIYKLTATTQGYPSIGIFNIANVIDSSNSSRGHCRLYIRDGNLSYDTSEWYGASVNLNNNVYTFFGASSSYTWTPLEDFSHNFDVMSAVSLNVNVQLTNNYENKAATASTNGTMVITPSTIWSVPYTFVTEYYRRLARFVIEGVGPQNYTNPLYRIDWNSYESLGFLLVKFNANGDELVIDDSNFNTSAYSYTFEYNENEDSYDFLMLNFKTPTPLSTGSTYDAMSAVTLTVNVPQSSAVLREKTITLNGTYSASTDNCDGYSAITVNVAQSGGTIKFIDYIETSGEVVWDTGFAVGNDIDAKIYLDYMPLTGNGYGDYWFCYYADNEQQIYFRSPGNSGNLGIAFGNNFDKVDGGAYNVQFNTRYKHLLDKNGLTDYDTNTLLCSVISTSINSPYNIVLGGQDVTPSISRCIPARFYSFKVVNGNNEDVLNMRPCLDNNNVPCFYEAVSGQYIYHQGSGTITAGPVTPTPDYASGYTDGQNSIISTFTATTATTNGVYGTSANPLSSITVNVPQTGSSATLGEGSFSANGTYSASTDNLDGYSAITINVPQSGVQIPIFFADYIHTDTLSADTYQDYIDTGLFPTDDVVFRVKGYRKGEPQGNRIVGWTPDETTHRDEDDFRLFWAGGDTVYFDWGYGRINYDNYFDSLSGYTDITCGNYYVYDNVEEQMIVSGSQESVSELYSGGTIRADVGSWWLKSLEIYDGNTLLFDGVAAYDGSGNVGLYDKVSHTLKTAVTTKQMVYEFDSGSTLPLSSITFTANTSVTVSDKAYTAITVNVDTASTYNSGYTEGQNDVISTFSSMTATTNGIYGTSAHPLSSITVNVPQSGMNINTLATRNYSISNPSISTNVSRSAFQNASGVTGQLTLTDAVSQIFAQAFWNSGINSIVWPSVTCYIRGEQVFAYSRLQGELVIPQNIVFNSTNGTFGNCTGLTSIVFYVSSGNSGIIEANTFANCTNVTAVTLYNCYNSINSGAFYNCASLAVINSYSSTAPSLGSDTFEDIPSNGTVHYPSGADYSSWQNYQYLSGWTFIGDL